MEYQKIKNLPDNTQNQRSKFMTKNWFEIDDNSNEKYNINSTIKSKNLI